MTWLAVSRVHRRALVAPPGLLATLASSGKAPQPEVFVGVEGCSDEGPGDRERPFCTFAHAFEVADSVPYIVTVLDGVYRQRSHRFSRPGTADAYFVIRAAEGARPVILGSEALAGADFEPMEDGTWRLDVSELERDPKGLWLEDGTRVLHVMARREGVRSHADVSALTEPNRWTKADASGTGSGNDNAGCFIYIRPEAGMDIASARFEASQGSFFYAGASTAARKCDPSLSGRKYHASAER